MIKAALFDLDGVIFNTEPQYTVFWGKECRRYYPDKPGLEETFKGQTLVQIYDMLFSGELEGEREAVTRRLDEFEKNMDYDYVEGFKDFVKQLRAKGVKTAVVTSSNAKKMAVVYGKHPEFKGMFDAILTSEDFKHSKPHPECYLTAAERFGLQPSECVVFEDSFNGLKSGKAAQMYVVGLTTAHPAEELVGLCDETIANFKGKSFAY